MTSKTIKELWRIEGKHRIGESFERVQNALYGFTGNPLQPYSQSDQAPDYCIFTVADTSGLETGWLFENDMIDDVRIGDRLKAFIENDGKQQVFYRLRNTARTDGKPKISLHDLLYSFRYGMTAEQTRALDVEMIDSVATINICGVEVFDLTWNNIVSDEKLSAVFFSSKGENKVAGSILHGKNTLCINLPEWLKDEETGERILIPRHFTTQFDKKLGRILNVITRGGSWVVGCGALLAVLPGADRKQAFVSFAEIVGTYHRGQIDLSRPIESIVENHTKLMRRGIVYDHMTHNKMNNFPWALAPIPDTLNKQLQGRDKIKPPYYFFTLYDPAVNQYRVKLGFYNLWERRYLFDDLGYRNGEDIVFTLQYKPTDDVPGKDCLYATVYRKFLDKIGPANRKAKTSYLSHWADPERAFDPDNMYTAMLDEPVETYRPALEAWIEDGENFDDMPMID